MMVIIRKNKSIKFAPAFMLVFTLLGCTKLGPNFQRPDVSITEEWIQGHSESIIAETGEEAYSSTWWDVFQSPFLGYMINHAKDENLSLKAAAFRVLQARAQLKQTKGEFFPQEQSISGGVGFSDNNFNDLNQTGHFFSSDLGLNLSWELDFWGKFRRAIEADEAAFFNNVANYGDVMLSLETEISSTYVAVATLMERLDVAKSNAMTQGEAYRIARVRFENGQTSGLDVDQAKTTLEQVRSTIPLLEAQLRQTQNTLAILLNMAPAQLENFIKKYKTTHTHPLFKPILPETIEISLPKDLLRRRPDVRSAEFQAASFSAQIGVAAADLYPSFSLNGAFSSNTNTSRNGSLTDVFKFSNPLTSVGLNFNFPLFNYGRLEAQVEIQNELFKQAAANYQNIVLNAQKEVEDSIAGYSGTQKQLGHINLAVKSAISSQRISSIQYQDGETDFTTVLTAEQALLATQDAQAQTRGNTMGYIVDLYKAIGGGWKMPTVDKILKNPEFQTDKEKSKKMKETRKAAKSMKPENKKDPVDVQDY